MKSKNGSYSPPHHSPKPPRGQTPQHMPCLPVTNVLPPATPFESKTANLTTQPTPPFDSHCQFSYHLIHASNPNYPPRSCIKSQLPSPHADALLLDLQPNLVAWFKLHSNSTNTCHSTPTTVPSPSSTHFTVSLPACLGADKIAYFI